MSQDILRFVQLGAGLAVTLHYMWMANYITRAPHYVRALLLPMTTGAGVGLIVASISGDTHWAAIFSTAACGSMAALQVAAWAAGAHVSKEFERLHQARAEANLAIDTASAPSRYVADFLDSMNRKAKKEVEYE